MPSTTPIDHEVVLSRLHAAGMCDLATCEHCLRDDVRWETPRLTQRWYVRYGVSLFVAAGAGCATLCFAASVDVPILLAMFMVGAAFGGVFVLESQR